MHTLALVLTALTICQSPQSTPVPEVRELRFAWPEGTTARVETERTRERRTGTSAPQRTRVRARHRMRVLPHDEGALIRYDEYELLEPKTLQPEADAVGQILTALSPSIVVDDDGRFVRVEDVAMLRAMIDEMFAPLRGKFDEMPGLKDLFSAVTSEAFLTGLTAQEWAATVASWLELPLVPGMVSVESEETSPAFPGVPIPFKTTIGMVGRAPCMRGGTAYECATMELSSSPDQKAMDKILMRMMEGVKGMEGFSYDSYDIVTTIRITLEAETMLPHEFEMTKTVRMSATIPNEGKMEGTQVDRRTAKYTYLPSK